MIDDKEHLAVGKSIKSPYRHYNCYCWAATHDFAHSERSAWIRLCSWNGESNEDKKRQIGSQLKPWHNRGNFHRLHQQRSIHLIKPMIRVTCQANMLCICKTELQHENVPEPGWYARMFDRISSGKTENAHAPEQFHGKCKNRHVRSMTIQYHCFQKTQLLSHKSATSAASLLATSISQYIL